MSSFEPKWSLAHKFCGDFNVTISELASRLDALRSGPDAVSPAMIQDVASDLSRLAKSLGDTIEILPTYDQRQCELRLKTLEKNIEELRAASAALPKFSFKRKATKPKPTVGHELDTVSGLTKPPIESPKALAGLSCRYLTVLDALTLGSSAEASISDLDHCIVNLLPGDNDQTRITALHVQRVNASVVMLPQISGSILLHNISNCVIAVGCHQFRMHDSTTVDVYLQSTSDPTIEHCSSIQFAPYPSSLIEGEFLQNNMQFAVKDFSHILPTPSPHWCSLLKERREMSWPVSILQEQALREELDRMLPSHSGLRAKGLGT